MKNYTVKQILDNQPALENVRIAFIAFWEPVNLLGPVNFVALDAYTRDYSPAEMLAFFLVGWCYGTLAGCGGHNPLEAWEAALKEAQDRGFLPDSGEEAEGADGEVEE